MKTVLVFLLSLVIYNSNAQTVLQQLEKKYGYVTTLKNGVYLVSSSYSDYLLFDKAGNQISKPYTQIKEFSNGMMRGRFEKSYVLIASSGKEASAYYDDMSDVLEDDRIMVALKRGNILQYGFIDGKGKIKIECKYARAWDFRAEATAVLLYEEKPDSWAVIDKNDNVLFADPRFRNYYRFDSLGMASVNDGKSLNNKMSTAKIHKSGKIIVPGNYTRLGSFDKWGITYFQKDDNLYGLINLSGKEIVKGQYTSLQKQLNDGYIAYTKTTVGIINKYGKEIFSTTNDWKIALLGKDRWSLFHKPSKKYTVLNEEGKQILPADLDQLYLNESFILANRDGKRGAYDLSGKEIIPIKYTFLQDYGENMLLMSNTDKGAFADGQGKLVTEFKYDSAYPFTGGYATVYRNGKAGLINKKGVEVVPLKYDFINVAVTDLRLYQLNGKFGMLALDGKELTPAKYDNIYGTTEGMTVVLLNNKFGFIDNSGKEVIIPQYENVDFFSGGKAPVSLKGEVFYIDKTGKKVK